MKTATNYRKGLSYYLIILFVLASVAAAIVTLASCGSQRGGCYATRHMSGYGH